ncbi:unnamed protein product [Hyaloperonospora brassicae]|uniref:TRUD domain-containing protein n=1 Tax=Hyaloperonospora brassicae TaxID=162125 RepID=A0AAV0UH09_HYABA|nr:unnamed protein product [Hyaloperonospora brassicae]
MTSRRGASGRRSEHSHWKSRRFGTSRSSSSSARCGHAVSFRDEGYNDHESVCIAEDVAGIAGFRTPSQIGFHGVVKQRYDDFLVHELRARSRVPVVLQHVVKKRPHVVQVVRERVLACVLDRKDAQGLETDGAGQLDVDKQLHETLRQVTGKLQQTLLQQQIDSQQAHEAYHLRQLVLLVSKEIGVKKGKEFEQFLKRVEQAQEAFERKQREKRADTDLTAAATAAAEGLTFYLGGLNDKADRVFIHETMRRYGRTRIVGDTLNIGSDTAVIRVRPRFAVQLLPGERDEKRDWPVGQPDYLQFTLYKRNKETTAVISQLASMLKVLPKVFSYAEVKDKRGVTTQLCTMYRVRKSRAQLLLRPSSSRKLEDQPFLVGDLRYVPRMVELGDCAGNRIAMVIRSLPDENKLSKDDVGQAVRSWETCGFINFFGLQRFGHSSTSYHLLGRAVLRKDYKLAVLLVLRPQEGEASKIRAVRENFRQHKDVAAALRLLPPFLVPERAVLEGLQQHGMDAHKLAFNNIPKPLRVSFVEAYRYFVWNEMASMRMSKLSSTSAVVGDIVFAKEIGPRMPQAHGDTSEPTKKRQRTEKSLTRRRGQEIVELTANNVDQYSIEDVVLPLPGHAIKYPTNEIGAAYRKMLTTDGIDLNAHFGADGSQEYLLDGSYRHVVKKPTRVSFRLERYTDPTKPLLLNDVDALLAESSASSHGIVTPETTADKLSQEQTEDGLHRALVLEFDLDYDVDAMSAIRELMKQSGSAHVHWKTSNSHTTRGEATQTSGGPSNTDSGSSGVRATTSSTKSGRGDARKIIKAQKTTQVAIGRPGFSLGRS